MKLYKLLILYDKNEFCKNKCCLEKAEQYFVGEMGLDVAKKYFLLAKNNENVYGAHIHLCDTDSSGNIIPVERLEFFIRNKYFILAENNDNTHGARIRSCDIDFDGNLIPDERT